MIDGGATVNSITNSGNLLITRSGSVGTAAAIVDKSGTVGLVQNSGSISIANASALGNAATAIDLCECHGCCVRQVAAAGKPAPSITGNILFGSGNDTLDIQSGNIIGNVDFGGGSNTLTLTGNGLFRSTIANSGALALNVGATSTFDVQNLGAINLSSLTTARALRSGEDRRHHAHAVQCFRHGAPRERNSSRFIRPSWNCRGHLHDRQCWDPRRRAESHQFHSERAVPVQQHADGGCCDGPGRPGLPAEDECGARPEPVGIGRDRCRFGGCRQG